MLAKKSPIRIDDPSYYRKQLQNLYARRFTINTLIESLERYDRFQPKSETGRKRKTA